jgi:hypothetical protein
MVSVFGCGPTNYKGFLHISFDDLSQHILRQFSALLTLNIEMEHFCEEVFIFQTEQRLN